MAFNKIHNSATCHEYHTKWNKRNQLIFFPPTRFSYCCQIVTDMKMCVKGPDIIAYSNSALMFSSILLQKVWNHFHDISIGRNCSSSDWDLRNLILWCLQYPAQSGAPSWKITQSSYNKRFNWVYTWECQGKKVWPKKSSSRVGGFDLKIWDLGIFSDFCTFFLSGKNSYLYWQCLQWL